MTRLFGVALVAAALGGCPAPSVGTIEVALATAPGSTVLDGIQRVRLTLTTPREVVEAERTEEGISLAIEIEAVEDAGALIVEGFDATGGIVAAGQSPAFPVTGIDARIVIYVAAPLTIAPAPMTLGPPRTRIAAARLPFGAIFAGGDDAAGAPTTELAIYNTYDHTVAAGLPLPSPRSGLAIAPLSSGAVYLFGGEGPDGAATGTLWLFDTTVAPAGAYQDIGDHPSLARADAIAVGVAADRFLVTGTPAAVLGSATATAFTGAPALQGAGTAAGDTAVFAGDAGIVSVREDVVSQLAGPHPGAAVATLPDGRVIVVGTPAESRVIDPATGTVTPLPGFSRSRTRPAVAATDRHLVVAGGLDEGGQPIATADIYDATTLARITTVPVAARAGAFAIALPNDQILIGGGEQPTDLLELFTPTPPVLD